jgi:hypothetical protein
LVEHGAKSRTFDAMQEELLNMLNEEYQFFHIKMPCAGLIRPRFSAVQAL